MAVFSISARARQLLNSRRNSNNHLQAKSSSNDAVSYHLVLFATVLLVMASMGFAAFFGWLLGSQYSPLLGCLMVLMAVGIEIAKPFSIRASIAALQEWCLMPALVLGMAGLVAIAFSASAELSLNAMMRSDFVAQRTGGLEFRDKASQRYLRAEQELTSLAPSRPSAEVTAELEGLLLLPGVDGCKLINGPVTQKICPRVAELRAESGRAYRRAELLGELKEAEAEGKSVPAVAASDPGATALAAYLGALGVPVAADKLSLWLPLIAVLALQLGSSTSALLIQAMKPMPMNAAVPASQAKETSRVDCPIDSETDSNGGFPRWLAESVNGTAVSLRKLSRQTGISKSALHRELHRLRDAGLLVINASPAGTRLSSA